MSYLQVKTVSVLALMFLFHVSVSGQGDVIISIEYKETSNNRYHVVLSEEQFRQLYGYMCSCAQSCSAKYSLRNAPYVDVTEVVSSTVQIKTFLPVYQCKNDLSRDSLVCTLRRNTSLPENYVDAQKFRLNNPDCQPRYVTLIWFHNDEGLTVYADIPDFEFCETAFDCASTTRRPETSSSAPVSSTTSKKEDKGDDNTGVMAGIAVAIFIVGIGVGIVVVVVLVRWKRRKNQGNKKPEKRRKNQRTKKSENEMSNSPSPAPLALSAVTSAADTPTNAISLPSETSEASPREPSSIAIASTPQNNYSQIDVSNTDGHAYAALSPSPDYNSTNENSTESTYEENADTPNSTSANCNTPDATPNSSSAHSAMPNTSTEYSNTQRDPTNIVSDQPETDGENTDTSDSTPAYCNTPDATASSSSAYPAMPTTTTEYSNTQRDPTNIVSDQPETDDVYEEVNVTNSPGRGGIVNHDASVDGVKEKDNDTVYSDKQRDRTNIISDQPETDDVYEEFDVTNSPGRGDTVNLDASVDGVEEQDSDSVYSN